MPYCNSAETDTCMYTYTMVLCYYIHVHVHITLLNLLQTLLYFAWTNQRHCQCCIHHTAWFTWRHTLYSTACDNDDSFSLSYTRNKAGKMQRTINQLKHGAVCAIMVLRMVSIDYTARGVALCCMAILATLLVPLLCVQHFLLCFN